MRRTLRAFLVSGSLAALAGCGSGTSVDNAPGAPSAAGANCASNWQASCAEARAYWVSADTIAWSAGSAGDRFTLHFAPDGGLNPSGKSAVGGEVIGLSVDSAGLPSSVTNKFPHLAGLLALRLEVADAARAGELLKGQVAIQVADASGRVLDATGLQLPGVLDDLFAYDGPLGLGFEGGAPVFRLWAPTARSVTVHIYADASAQSLIDSKGLTEESGSGVWLASGAKAWMGRYYIFEVEVYAPSTGRFETNRVTDPYSVSLAADSALSHIADLDDPALAPPGWHASGKPAIGRPIDISVYELHVRDFSIADQSVPVKARGTFMAFTHTKSHGMRHLKALSDSGLSHLHLLPVFDLATVSEDRSNQATADVAKLSSLPPDSDRQQAMIEAIKEDDGFNWGYDPWHYTVPEGSYATDPEGPARIVEFRRMVKSLNEIGLNVVMDVVYNHTSQSGQGPKSVLDRIVPGYYQRLNAAGAVETSTCCANTATEHAMMEKLMIDSVLTWARDYKVDGFRFDLMGHHSKQNMLNLRAALDALTVENDGVDGRRIYLYGEGWNFGEVQNDARFEQATQANMAGTGIGTFNDRLRDGARGGTPFIDPREQGFINGLGFDPNAWEQAQDKDHLAELRHTTDWIRIGLTGGLADYDFVDGEGRKARGAAVDYLGDPAGYTAQPQELISYVAAHDNETLFDVIQMKAPAGIPVAGRVRMQNLANSLVALGQGIPFFHAGQDILRSKSMDRDSFNSGDWFNQIDWTLTGSNWGKGLPIAEKNSDKWPLMQPLLADPALVPGQADREASRDHLLELLRIRQSSELFRMGDAEAIKARLKFHNTGPDQLPGLIVMSVADNRGSIDANWTGIVVLFNANDEQLSFAWRGPGGQEFDLHPVQVSSADPVVRTSYFDTATNNFVVPARTAAVFVAPQETS